MKGKNRCTVLINPADAEKLGLENQQVVKVSSRVGSVEIVGEITDKIAQGVVSIPHGYGHGREGTDLDVANIYGGVSINDLTDDLEIDELTGNAAFNGVKVKIEKKT
jgi:anaerobic selenocysteine-containing dehydrogenase